jgi:hypothetical protein
MQGLVETAFVELAARWKPLLSVAEEVGVDIAWEVHPRCAYESISAAARVHTFCPMTAKTFTMVQPGKCLKRECKASLGRSTS